MRRPASTFASLQGWRRRALACALGALAMLGLPPFGLVPVLAIAFTGLVWLMDGVAGDARRGFWTCWWVGFGHLVVGLYWIALALLVEADKFAWLVPFAVLVLPAGLALFYGAAGAVAARLWRPGWRRVVVLALAWSLAEWLRGHVLTGFPWNIVGYAWVEIAAPRQLAALLGLWGVSLATLVLAGLPATLADDLPAGRLARARPVLVGLAGLALAFAFGAWRLEAIPPAGDDGPMLRIVQGNIDQHTKWSPEDRQEILSRHMRLSRAPAARTPKMIIWPETATPYLLDTEPANAALVGQAAPPGGVLATGVVRVRQTDKPDDFEAWNSLVVLDGTGAVKGIYDKAHLVPFGEYVPARGVLARLGIERIAHSAVDFSDGPGPRTLHVDGVPPFSPLICYEAIFPGRVLDRADRPDWLLNVTNDAWFGTSIGPHQHLAMARLRAVEEGMPLVRAANTGISAVFDSAGREVAHLGLGETGVLDVALPPPASSLMPYARFGDWVYAAFFCLLMMTTLQRRL